MKRMSEVFELPMGAEQSQGEPFLMDSNWSIASFDDFDTYNDGNGFLRAQHAAHAINSVDSLEDALEEALLQIEYLHQTFEETGSGNSVLLRGYAALNAYRGEK